MGARDCAGKLCWPSSSLRTPHCVTLAAFTFLASRDCVVDRAWTVDCQATAVRHTLQLSVKYHSCMTNAAFAREEKQRLHYATTRAEDLDLNFKYLQTGSLLLNVSL